ncbi:MAG: hypothetical protein VYD87_21010 [Pseudomonadota bacterium]|nr:hypothetical protein [Pseudomonadota bacterium]
MPRPLPMLTAALSLCCAGAALAAPPAGGTPPLVATPAAASDPVAFRKLPDETVRRFNSHDPATPVNAGPEIRALEDPSAEARYRQQVDRARALKALERAGTGSLSGLPDMTTGAPRD